MESTGVYWLPVLRVLEGSFEIIIGNAQYIKNGPDRKTDVNWPQGADLLGRAAHAPDPAHCACELTTGAEARRVR